MKKILFTRKLSEKQKNYAKSKNLDVIDIPFIECIPNEFTEYELKIIKNPKWSSWVFTSQNAIKFFPLSFKPFLQKQIFCVGNRTYDFLFEKGFNKIYKTKNTEELLYFIQKHEINNVIYFCGNLRQDNLSKYFITLQLNYIEIKLYTTKLFPKTLNMNNYDGICFCSPSSVKSFLQKNLLPPIPKFAIGQTTANILKKYDYCHIAKEATIESMIEKVYILLK